MVRESEMYALVTDRGPRHFYLHQHQVEMAFDGEVGKYRLTEDPDGDGDFWAWWNNEDKGFVFCWQSEGQLDMCFPYGPEVSEKHGDGHKLSVKVERVSS